MGVDGCTSLVLGRRICATRVIRNRDSSVTEIYICIAVVRVDAQAQQSTIQLILD